MSRPGHVKILEEWLQSYRPCELFDETGRLRPELAELAPSGTRRMGANPHANGGLLLRDLRLPDFRDRSEEHTSELQSLMRISYAVFRLQKKKLQNKHYTA